MRRLSRLALLVPLALALAGCVAPQDGGRRPGAKLYSMAGFDTARLAGQWHEVAGIYDPARQGCALGLTRAAVQGGHLVLAFSDCAGPAATVPAKRLGDARFAPRLAGPRGQAWWVLWVDQDNRTAVIGTPSGAWAAVLNRTPRIPADRMEAARRILDFNGYDARRLISR